MTEKKQKKTSQKKRALYIYLPLAAVIIIAASLSAYFMFFKVHAFGDRASTYISVDRETVVPGESLSYRLFYTNSARRKVEDLDISISLPGDTSMLSVATPGKDAYYDETRQILSLDVGDLEPAQSGWAEFRVIVDTPADDGRLIESGEVTFEYVLDGKARTEDLRISVYSEVDSSPELASIEIDMIDVNGYAPETGDRLKFIITFDNIGTMDAKGVKVYNDLPEDMEVDGLSVTEQGIYNPFNNSISWDISVLEAGNTQVLEYTAVVGEGFDNYETFTNKVEVTMGSQKASAEHKSTVYAYEDLGTSEVTLEDVNGGKTWAWDRLRYTFRIKNTGKRVANGFRVTCPIPQGTGYIKGSATGEDYRYYEDTNTLEWTLSGLKTGEVMEVSFDVNVGGHLTGGGYIEDGFTLSTSREDTALSTTGVKVEPYAFQTIVLMGDSHIALNDWPETLGELLEITYPHAVFNIIESAVPGEMAIDAIERFDESVRIHNPDIIILGYGTNDSGAETGFFRHHMGILAQQAKSTGAEVFIYNIGYIDTSGRWSGKTNYKEFNDILEEDIAISQDVNLIDLNEGFSKDPDKYIKPDGMHWTEEGEDLAANIIFRSVYEILDEDGRIKE